MQVALGAEDWGDMLLDPGYDEAVDATEALAEACRLYPEGLLSWRSHSFANKTLGEA
jgi:hypothetical protein